MTPLRTPPPLLRRAAAAVALALILCARPAFPGPALPAEWDRAPRPGAGAKAPVELGCGALLAVDTRTVSSGTVLLCYRSDDAGGTWTTAGVVASHPAKYVDLGDAALLAARGGEIYCSYRRNFRARRPGDEGRYSIRVSVSRDGGATWTEHSQVDSAAGPPAGLWSTFLLERPDGALQCYYDDEASPWRAGFRRHQWLTMRTWNPMTARWENPVTVSRARDPAHLSRDGMCSVVETGAGRLLCVFESVDTEAPHKGVLRSTFSDDGGRSWSWSVGDRPVLWRPADREYNALAPWAIRLSTGALLCVFVTDEDRSTPDVPSTSILDEDVKAVASYDEGASWSPRPRTLAADHPCYLPGVVELKCGPAAGRLLLQYSGRGGMKTLKGRVAADRGSKRP